MNISKLAYEKVFNLGNYENDKIRVEVDILPGESTQEALQKARNFVDINSATFQKKVREAEETVRDVDRHTGRQVKTAKEFLEAYQAKVNSISDRMLTASVHERKEVDPE